MNKAGICSVVCLIAFVSTIQADQVTITADMDGGYFAAGFDGGVPSFVDNNLGGHTHVPVGQANSDRVNRGIFGFDIVSNIPAGATINTVSFDFEVTLQGGPNGQAGVDFSLHRVTTDWDEGTGVGNIGEMTFDGASWRQATATVDWTVPGGVFDMASLGAILVDGPADYSISSSDLADVVQGMLDGTFPSYGFILKASPEGVFGSAARVTTREGGNAAQLVIDFNDTLLGDVNLDGSVDLLDVAPFVQILSSAGFQAEADINQDGMVNLLDVAPFVSLLSG